MQAREQKSNLERCGRQALPRLIFTFLCCCECDAPRGSTLVIPIASCECTHQIKCFLSFRAYISSVESRPCASVIKQNEITTATWWLQECGCHVVAHSRSYTFAQCCCLAPRQRHPVAIARASSAYQSRNYTPRWKYRTLLKRALIMAKKCGSLAVIVCLEGSCDYPRFVTSNFHLTVAC